MAKLKDALFEMLRDFGEIEVNSMFIVVEQPGSTDGVLLRWNCSLLAALGACTELAALRTGNVDDIPSFPGKTRRLDG